MMNQPQRLLSKSRKSSARQSSDDDDESSIENDGWIATKPKKQSASLSFVRDGDRNRGKTHNNAVSFAKKPSPFAAGGDSSSDSDDSHVNISKRNKKKSNRNDGKSNKANNLKSKKSTMPRAAFNKVANRLSKAGTRASTTPENAPSSTATSRANRAPIPEGITSPSQLQWYRILLGQSKKGNKGEVTTVSKIEQGEVFDYKRKHGGGIGNNDQGTTIIEYLTLSNDNKTSNNSKNYICVDDNLLIPFGYRSRDGISFTFNDDYLTRYMQEQRKVCSPSDLEAQKLFIERVFSHAIRMEKETKQQADKDLEDYYDDCSFERGDSRVQFEVDEESNDGNDESDDEELDAPYTQAITFDPDKFEPMAENETSNEPIRVGDVIEYYSPIHVAGDPRGLRQATVLAIDPKNEIPLVLDNAECIPNDTNVKRIKVKSGGELLDHPGIFRPIFRFKLVKAGRATAADALKMQSSRFGGIMRNNMKKLKSKAEAEGFAPMDMLVSIKGANDSSQSSSEVSAPRPKASRKIQRQSLPPSSSESFDDDSSDEEESSIETSKPLVSNARDVEMVRKERAYTPKLKENKENASSASRSDRKLSLGSLSSKASLGTSLASSSDDDSSIESAPLNLGKNHKNMTQPCQQNKYDVKKTKSSGVLDLSISSDESVIFSPKKAQTKSPGVCSTKHTSLKGYLSSVSSVSSESSLEVMKPKKMKNGTSYNSSCSTATGSSKTRSELRKRTPEAKKPSSHSSSAGRASPSENSAASSSTKRKRTPKPNIRQNSSQEHSSESSKLSSTKKQQRKETTDSEATSEMGLGWTQTSGGWVKSNENTGFSFSIGRFK